VKGETIPSAVAWMQTERDPFEVYFLENYERIYRLLYRVTGAKAEAEDLTVETFVRAWQHSTERMIPAWLYQVAMRLGYNALRSKKRRTFYEQKTALYSVAPKTVSSPADLTERNEERWKVQQTLRNISARAAKLLLLHYSGFSYKEIATTLKISPNSVGALLARAEKEFERSYRKGG
jgi:RNA polymerase sigma factor (sigma-70 family)